ncbi:MAG TPA: hypothetical protein VK808_09955 [Bacteroidia bacterium]|nr:hypothetical protein [Bacteroidia bacterium]
MALILRVDVDKPYGRAGLFRKVISKLAEDYWFPQKVQALGYLSHLEDFLQFCNSQKVSGYIYHRICTVPDDKIIKLLQEGKHKLGLHAENTRSYETFSEELSKFKKMTSPLAVESFTKHGSGELKLGRNHYPPYEPGKYKEWAVKAHISYFFGNGICKSGNDFNNPDGYFENMFWIEREYRDPDFFDFGKLIREAKKQDVPVLIHPCNYNASRVVKEDFEELVRFSRRENIEWKLL